MKSSTILFVIPLLFASSSIAQTACDAAASLIPTCGVPCITSAASAVGCPSSNYHCRCSSASVIQSSAQACVISNCGIETALQVQSSANAVCSCAATATGNVAVQTEA